MEGGFKGCGVAGEFECVNKAEDGGGNCREL